MRLVGHDESPTVSSQMEAVRLGRAPLRVRLVARRTLRRRVRVVLDPAGDNPVVMVEGTRLVLPPGARHFRHLLTCTTCGDDFVSLPVLSMSDIGRDVGSVCGPCMAHLA